MTARISALSDYYRENGYVIARGLVPADSTDALLSRYRGDILSSGSKFFRQSTDQYETNRLNDYGFVQQSFLDIHAYEKYPHFRRHALSIFFDQAMLDTLTQITGYQAHKLMQSMLFDANTATPPHQDWWYLDSVPNGHLLAAWIALEDIDERAGRFFVVPKSQELALHEPGLAHSDWLLRMRQFCEANPHRVYAPELRRGDVLFWNSRTVHGSLPTQDERYSRKSLTAHYLPAELTFGNLFTRKDWVVYRQHGAHQYFVNQPEYSAKAVLLSKVRNALYDHPALLKIARRLQRKSLSDLSTRA